MTTYTKASTILSVENISLSYDDKVVLRDINFEIKDIIRPDVKQGQVVSIIGKSGIGKTQLFKILAGLKEPTSGKVLQSSDKKPVKAGDMGVVSQNYYLFEWRTINKSLELSARKNPELKGNIQDAIRKYADDFQLTEHLSKYPQQLSGGQRQRVSIIQQLLNGSEFILFDEPFSGLDVLVLDKVTDLLTKVSLTDELKTLIIVSHDIETAVALSDTVFVLGTEGNKAGAVIKKEIDLCERGLAWQKDVKKHSSFRDTIDEIKSYL